MGLEFTAYLIVAFAVALVLCGILIPQLKRLKMRQTERKEGVQSHLAKAGTPTMGGISFLAASLLISFTLFGKYPRTIPVVLLMAGFGAIGFIDDYLKAVLKRSDGLIAWQKLLLQIAVTTVFIVCILNFTDISLDMLVPFSGGRYVGLGVISIPFVYIVVLATVNGVNFTDGLDGLASSVTIIVAVFFAAASFAKSAGVETLCCVICGSLMAFLCYNVYPAKVFMGDTGSLALGGFVAGMAYIMNIPLFIPIVGIIYAAELLSVVIQVSYFKATGGRRVFKMTPIHHHFELSGWSETRIVTVFCVITALACALAFIGL